MAQKDCFANGIVNDSYDDNDDNDNEHFQT
jgi:hypothetical protein